MRHRHACQMGAEAAMAPSTTAGYFIRNQPASIPPSGVIDSGSWGIDSGACVSCCVWAGLVLFGMAGPLT